MPMDFRRSPSLKPAKISARVGLDLRLHRVPDADHAKVRFVARLREANRAIRLHERSRLVRESAR